MDHTGSKLRRFLCSHLPVLLRQRTKGSIPDRWVDAPGRSSGYGLRLPYEQVVLCNCPRIPVSFRGAAKVIERNKLYYEKYPRDVQRVRSLLNSVDPFSLQSQVRKILQHLDSKEVLLPNGGSLSPQRWLQLGIDFGMHGMSIISVGIRLTIVLGGIDRVHREWSS